MPSCAVLIPLYNHAAYIGPALQSVLAQTRPPERIIVIDDGSTDDSVAAARAISDPRVEVLTQANRGAHHTLNRGVELARNYDFIAILNSDDLYEPTRLEKCLAVLETNAQATAVCTRFEMIDPAGSLLPPENPKARWVRTLWEARRDNPAEWIGLANFAKTTSNLVARTAWLTAHPFRDYRYVHDWHWFATCALERRLAVLSASLLRYRAHPTNTIKSGEPGAVAREVLQMNFDLLQDFAPRLATEPELRANYAVYLRTLLGNHTDFRAELFVQIIAQLTATVPSIIAQNIAALSVEQFPELAAKSSKTLRAEGELTALQRTLNESPWIAIGRIFGHALNAPEGAALSPEAKLSAFKKTLKNSTWLQFGRALGAVRDSKLD